MIIHLTTPWNNQTMTEFIVGPAVRENVDIRSMTYAELVKIDPAGLPRATWIFSDGDLLDPRPASAAVRTWARLADRGDRLLNHPTRSMGRYELLRTLHDRGINDFDVYRMTDPRRPRRYPVFVRWINAHSGPVSALLPDEAAFDRYLDRCLAEGRPRDVLMAVKHGDTREPGGLVREYGAYRVGDTILPEHLWFSVDWMVKQRTAWNFGALDVDRQALYREERRYMDENPHAAELRKIFDIARLEYGRIDYGVRDGRIQVWEINSNPLVTTTWTQAPDRDSSVLRDWFMSRFASSLRAIEAR